MACTYDGKEILGAKFQSPVGSERMAEILRLATVAGASRAAELAGYLCEFTGEPTPVSACYEQAEGVIRSDAGDWWDVLVKHVPDNAPRTYGDGSTFEEDANLCPDCSKAIAFAALRAGADAEASVLFVPNERERRNQLLSRFDDEFVRFRCDGCDETNC